MEIRDVCDLDHCEAVAAFGLPSPEALAADPDFPQMSLRAELLAAYLRPGHEDEDLAAIKALWEAAAAIWREVWLPVQRRDHIVKGLLRSAA